ncbi:hypothetical protein [Streptomyces corynorhini]|uniref:Lipoprotein n=1 Tax=Streptomyces corynorhini TaxID=2282652 RepID=A0A370B6L8_9ACTN|nr:hypothetical protein [Streptomyces corynorhini]RDG35396.1 hypothetical protein DVH02_25565 [Streptomyces corynorhini]
MNSREILRWLAAAAASTVLVTVTAGCGADTGGAAGSGGTGADGALPEGWGTLRTSALTVAHPPGFTPQSATERSKYNAAAATLSEGGKDVGMITVQLDFTDADSAEEAAIGAEAGIALGSTLGKQSEIEVAGPGGKKTEARRVDFEFTERGSRVKGVIVAGVDTAKKTYAVRIDAVKGKLGDGDLRRILDSLTLK